MFILQVGKTAKVSVEFTNLGDGEDPGSITWASGTPAVATVVEDSQTELRADVTGVTAGNANITATPSNGAVPAATFAVKVVAAGTHSHIQVSPGL